MKVIKSASNTIITALSVVDNVTNGVGSAARMFESAMKEAEEESRLEAFVEEKKRLKESGLTEQEIEEFKQLKR